MENNKALKGLLADLFDRVEKLEEKVEHISWYLNKKSSGEL